ncbi:MAG: hypothetical protein F8N37_00100 [Telmatospirillum sp.]|nr:hypothetical protein [Telmatospirillum sp.]
MADMDLDAAGEEFLPPDYGPNVLVVMARGRAEGLWRPAGGTVDPAALGLPADLGGRLRDWSGRFTRATRNEEDPDRLAVLDHFTAEGLSIAQEVQSVLGPDWEILFFDEARLEADGYLVDYLYPAGRAV